jgi:hypothetical protein
MQNITSKTSSNGLGGPDTVLIQAEGNTGDQVKRDSEMDSSLNDFNKEMGEVPERMHAQFYDGTDWKAIDEKADSGRASAPGAA